MTPSLWTVGRIDDDRTDVEVDVESFEVDQFQFEAEPDELHLILVQLKPSR